MTETTDTEPAFENVLEESAAAADASRPKSREITTAHLAVFLAAADEEMGRPALTPVRLESDGTLVATNGHILASVLPYEAGEPISGIEGELRPHAVRMVLAGIQEKVWAADYDGSVYETAAPPVPLTIEREGEQLVLRGTDGVIVAAPAKGDAPFPGWRKTVKDLTTAPTLAWVSVAAKYLRTLADIVERSGGNFVTLYLREASQPIEAQWNSDGEWRVLVMPGDPSRVGLPPKAVRS